MSVMLMSLVFERYPCGTGRSARPGEMLLALALADKADDDGTLLRHRSVVDLARKTRQSERGVRLQLQNMVAMGWLQVVSASDGGRGQVSLYRISPDWVASGVLVAPGSAPLSGASARQEVETLHSVPCLENNETLHSTAQTLHSVQGLASAEKGRNPALSSGAYITRIRDIPPLPPKGGNALAVCHESNSASNAVSEKRTRGSKPLQSLMAWLAQCRAAGCKPVPESDPVFAYCAEVGISEDILALHWWLFKRRRREAGKMQRDWPMTLRNSVEGNWYRLWFIKPGQAAELSTQGLQAQAARAAEQRLAQASAGDGRPASVPVASAVADCAAVRSAGDEPAGADAEDRAEAARAAGAAALMRMGAMQQLAAAKQVGRHAA